MLISERIRHYRKKCGLSQEELGEKLLVSRQTISLWEQGQTVPTIDNLIRLKDIFHVSTDEILGVDEGRGAGAAEEPRDGGTAPGNHAAGTGEGAENSGGAESGSGAESAEGQDKKGPCERCSFSYTEEDCGSIYKSLLKNALIMPVLLFVCSVFLLLLVFTTDISARSGGVLIGLVVGALTAACAALFRCIRLRKRLAAQLQGAEVALDVYADSLLAEIRKEGEYRQQRKFSFSAVRKLRNTDDFLLIQWQDSFLPVKKEAIKGDSLLYACAGAYAPVAAAPDRKNRLPSLLFCLGSIAALPIAVILVSAVSHPSERFVQNLWILFLFTPVPIASVVLGFCWKAKKQIYKKNIIAGFIMIFLLCIYGSFTFIFSGIYDYSDKPVARVEQLTGIQLPQYEQIVTTDWTKLQQASDTAYIYYSSEVTFSAENEPDFGGAYADFWLETVPNDMLGLTVLQGSGLQLYDRFLFYNIDEETYNLLPAEEGNYRMLSIFYDSGNHEMRIMEYTIPYTV